MDGLVHGLAAGKWIYELILLRFREVFAGSTGKNLSLVVR